MASSAAIDYSTCFEYCEDGFPTGYSYLVTVRQKGKIEMRIREVTDERTAREWLSKLNKSDSTSWRVQRTYPRERFLKTVMFRQDMRCQHNTDKRYISGQKRTKNTDCAVTMSVIVKRTNVRYSRAKDNDPLLKDWPCFVKICGEHNHPLFIVSSESVDFEIDEETKQKLRHYFNKGHSVATALHMLKSQLLLDQPFDVSADSLKLPTFSSCRRLFNAEFKQQFEDRPIEHFVDDLKNLTDSHEALLRVTDDGHHVIFYCSSLMKRVHELFAQSNQILFIDAYSSSSGDQQRRLYLFTMSTPVGCLPLGIIITETISEELFEAALPTFTDECCPQSFNRMNPQLIITEYKFKEKRALANHFPNSQHLLCQASVLKDAWNWLTDISNDTGKQDRQEMLWCLKVLMYSQTPTQFEENYEEIMKSVMVDNYPNFRSYLNDLCQRKYEWASCFRFDLPAIEYSMSQCANELGASLLKEIMETRVMCFNMLQLFDFIVTIYDNYVMHKVLSYANGNANVKFLPLIEEIPAEDVSKHREPDIYFVRSGNENEDKWKIDLSRFMCTCSSGNDVEICQHTKAVMIHNHVFPLAVNVAFDRTSFLLTLMKVATGLLTDSTRFLCSIKPINSSQELQYENGLESEIKDTSTDDEEGNTLLLELGLFVERIAKGMKERPKEFYPALKAMINNVNKYANTEKDLLSAMYAFGTGNSKTNESTGKVNNVLINVQPVSIVDFKSSHSSTVNDISLSLICCDHDYSLNSSSVND